MNYDKIGSFIAEKRKEKNLTQKELANLIGVTDKAVSKWERGLGCPDVSILEILANILDISILEILKGRVIENEVIKVTEANDYVKDTIEYSNQMNKNKLKRYISNICIFLIFCIGLILMFLNVNHLLYLNQTEYYDFDSETINKMRQNVELIEENINIIKNNKGIYSDEDYIKIINDLDGGLSEIKSFSILNYEGEKYLTLSDLYIMDLDHYQALHIINTYEILSKYDQSIRDYNTIYKDTFIMRAFIGNQTFIEPENAYQYNLFLISSDPYLAPTLYRMNARLVNYQYQIDSFLYLTKNIIKVGDISE